MQTVLMKRRHRVSVYKIRMTLVVMVAMQFSNMLCMITSQITSVLSEESDFHDSPSFNNINFKNITALDLVARKAMERLHDDLDRDDDGNVSMSEGKQFINREEFVHGSDSNLPGFATDKDGRITAAEFWETWVKSSVHNWTVAQMADWLAADVDLPQYASKFKQYSISGAAMPILAGNSSLLLSLVDGVKEHRLKLWLKAMEVVLCGYSRSKSNFLKDVLLTISIALALGGIAFGVHVRRNAALAIATMQDKLSNLQREMRKIDEDEDWMKELSPGEDRSSSLRRNTESTESTSSLASECSLQIRLHSVLEELAETKMLLEQAEDRLSDKKWAPPSRLLTCLKSTHQVETKLHELKREQAQKKVEQAKSQFQKMKKKSSIFSSVHLVHSRQVDSFDLEIQNAKDLLKEIQRDSHEYKKRWVELESICKHKFVTSPSKRVSMTSARDVSLTLFGAAAVNGRSVITAPSSEKKMEADKSCRVDPSEEDQPGEVAGGLVMKDLNCGKLKESKIVQQVIAKHTSATISRSASSNSVRAPVRKLSPVDEWSSKVRTFPRKSPSPSPLRKNDSVQSCIIIAPDPSNEFQSRENSPRRNSSMESDDVRSSSNLQPGKKSRSARSLPDLSNDDLDDDEGREATAFNNDVTKTKKRTIGSLFKRKKKNASAI
ncbi:stromal interaction molecule homolog isoform X2 [Clavelina lepadiformis]|uniref:Uncharacterized protein n=1 Tax=Clavelina lepadiformis TaxID=159417 RepID=A0ABP0FYC5_CLALP